MSRCDIPAAPFDVERLRLDFPILDLKVNDKPLVFLDNAASSQMPRQVIERWVHYRSAQHANIHRAVHFLSETATAEYESARRKVLWPEILQIRRRDHPDHAGTPFQHRALADGGRGEGCEDPRGTGQRPR
jgi:hypothetical protein